MNTKARIAGSLAYWDGKPASYCPFDRGTVACREGHDGYESTRDEVEKSVDTVPMEEVYRVLGEAGA
jgi:hypothetical protein